MSSSRLPAAIYQFKIHYVKIYVTHNTHSDTLPGSYLQNDIERNNLSFEVNLNMNLDYSCTNNSDQILSSSNNIEVIHTSKDQAVPTDSSKVHNIIDILTKTSIALK